MPHTHYLAVIGDGHISGVPNTNLADPVLGQKLGLFTSSLIELNTVLRGATSGAVARVTRVFQPGTYMLEMIGNTFFGTPPGQPGGAWSPGPPFAGETITLDTGGTAVPDPTAGGQSLPGLSYLGAKREAELNTFTPEDPATDTVLYDRGAKIARNLVVPIASVSPVLPAITFVKGDRVTTSSGGGFTVQLITVVGSDYHIKAVRVTGTVAPGDTLTNTTRTGSATLTSIEADKPMGTWVPHHLLPNLASVGTFYEVPPWGDNGGVGVLGPICRGFWQKWKAAPDADDRGVRVVPFKTFDHYAAVQCSGTFPTSWTAGETLNGAGGWQATFVRFDATAKILYCENVNAYPMIGGTITGATSGASVTAVGLADATQPILGGVSIQTIKCSGTFPTTWTQGETVTSNSGFQAKVQGFNAAQKLLFVYETNGIACGDQVAGITSLSIATSVGPAYGWQKGSRFWTKMLAHFAEAQSREGALYNGSPAKWEGAALMMWESEIAPFAAGLGCPLPSVDIMRAEWRRLITDLRTALSAPDMPVGVFLMDVRSHSTDAYIIPGLPVSYLIRQAMQSLPGSLPKVQIISTDGMQPAQDTPLPYSNALLYLRTDDYWELGKRAWRAIEFADYTVPPGDNLEPLPIVLMLGFSYIVGNISPGIMSYDLDPDLYSSATFPGVSTLDTNVLNFNTVDDEWRPFDIVQNANNWLGSAGFGLEASFMLRAKKRFAEAPVTTAKVGLLKLAYNSASANGAVRSAPATFDPEGSSQVTTAATCTVTVIPANSNNAARGRFTAPAGTFSNWEVNAYGTVQGSALGLQGAGGNNSTPYRGGIVRAIAGDGSYVEIEGSFVPEGPRSFTLIQGPYVLWPEVEKQIRRAFTQAMALGYTPKPVAIITQLGVVDLERVDEFEAAYLRIHERLQRIFGQRHKGEEAVPAVIFEDNPKTPWAVPDSDVATLILAQRAVAAALPRAVSIDTSRLPMESGGIWPRTDRFKNGVHTTARGYLAMGFMADAALEVMGFPAHPDGPAMIEYGSPTGGVVIGGGSAVPLLLQSPGFPGTGNLIVEDGTGIDDAESLASVEDFQTFWDKNGSPTFATGATDIEVAAALRRSTREWLLQYSGKLRGTIQHLTQRLCFPRIGCYDDEGRSVPTGSVPQDFKDALCLVAGEILAGQQVLPSEVDRGQVTRETKKGAGFEKTIEYAPGSGSGASRRRIRAAEALIYPYVEDCGSQVSLS